jgi:hypothetical protein
MSRYRHWSILGVGLLALAVLATGRAVPSDARADEADPSVVATFQGSYDGFTVPQVLGPVHLHAGVVVVRARHDADKNFVINLRLPDEGASPETFSVNTYLLVDAVGAYEGAAAEIVPTAGDYYLLIAAGGGYDITVAQPTAGTVAPVEQTAFEGRGQQVTPATRLVAGAYTLEAQTDAAALLVWLYAIDDAGGGAVSANYDGRVIDTGRGTGTTVTIEIPADGLYLFAVEPLGAQGTAWSLTLR